MESLVRSRLHCQPTLAFRLPSESPLPLHTLSFCPTVVADVGLSLSKGGNNQTTFSTVFYANLMRKTINDNLFQTFAEGTNFYLLLMI